jgi:carbonic anhydrase/acetyltransferase-like protein (isoleucine patch superfamily)
MEQAVLRAAGRFPLTVGHHVLIGPHAYLSGCEVGDHCFIATGAMVFNGASLGDACVVALDGKVHIQSQLAPGSRVPIGFIAIGRPAQIYPPDQAPGVHEELARLDFMGYVFGVGSRERSRAEVMEAALNRYVRGLSSHQNDTAL